MLLKSDKPSYVQFIDESRTNWYFTVVSQNGEIGLISAHDLRTGEVIELGKRLKKCIFVRPEEYADLIEELEAMRDEPEKFLAMSDSSIEASKNPDFIRGLKTGLEYTIQLVAQRANPQPGIE